RDSMIALLAVSAGVPGGGVPALAGGLAADAQPPGDLRPGVPEGAQPDHGVLDGGGFHVGGEADHGGEGFDVARGDAAAGSPYDAAGERAARLGGPPRRRAWGPGPPGRPLCARSRHARIRVRAAAPLSSPLRWFGVTGSTSLLPVVLPLPPTRSVTPNPTPDQ